MRFLALLAAELKLCKTLSEAWAGKIPAVVVKQSSSRALWQCGGVTWQNQLICVRVFLFVYGGCGGVVKLDF